MGAAGLVHEVTSRHTVRRRRRLPVMLSYVVIAAAGCQGAPPEQPMPHALFAHLQGGLDSCLELPKVLPPLSRTRVPSRVNQAIHEAWDARIDLWFEGIRAHDERAYLRSGFAVAHLLFPFWERLKPGDVTGRRALTGVAEWLSCPCEHHLSALAKCERDLEGVRTGSDGPGAFWLPATQFKSVLCSLLETIRDPRHNSIASMHGVLDGLVQDADDLGLSRAYVMADEKTDFNTADEEREIACELIELGSKATWFRALHAAVCAELAFDRPSRAQ